jgi:TolA-binding protein
MVLNNFAEWKYVVRTLLLGSMVYGALMISGCASGEEVAAEDEGFSDEPATAEQAPAEEAKEEAGDQQALTSFIGAAPKKEEPKQQPVVQQEAPPPAVTTPVEDVQTENTSLKQKLVKLEQDVRTLNARISDTEAKYMAEKDRADKAEEAAKVSAQSAVISARGGQVTEEVMTPASEVSMDSYDRALELFKGRKYDDAIGTLEGMLNSGVSKNLEDNCHYWIGESNFGKKNYPEAMKHFEMVFDYSNSEKLADARFMVAQCLERTGNKARAKEAYERVIKDFPMSRLVHRAKERSSRL